MGQNVLGMPADLLRTVAHEIVGLEFLPQGQRCLIGDTELMQEFERLALIFPDPQLEIRWVFQPQSQCFLGGEVEFAQQGSLPVIP